MSKKYCLGLMLLLILACSEKKEPIIVQKEGVTMTLPGFVKEDELANDAIIEYANRYRNFYIAAFKYPVTAKDTLWQSSTKRIYQSLESHKIDSSTIDNTILSHIKGNFKGEKEPIYYTQKIIFGSSACFLLTVWTRGDERYKHHKETIGQIVSSFKMQ